MPKKTTDIFQILIPLRLKNPIRDEWKDGIREKLELLTAIGREFDGAAESIRENRELSDHGRFAARERAARVALEKIAAFEKKTIDPLRERIAWIDAQVAKKASINRPTDPGDRLAYEMRLGEIRSELRKLDPLERFAIYMSSSDPLVIDAIETAPSTLVRKGKGDMATFAPFIDPERVSAARLARVEAADPELAQDMSDVQRLANLYVMDSAVLRQAIVEEVPAVRQAIVEELPAVVERVSAVAAGAAK